MHGFRYLKETFIHSLTVEAIGRLKKLLFGKSCVKSRLVLPLSKNIVHVVVFFSLSLHLPWGQFHIFANIKTWSNEMAGGVALFPPPPPPPGLQFAISRLPHFLFLRPTYHCKQVVNRRGGWKKRQHKPPLEEGVGDGLDGGGGGPGV